MRRGRSEAIEVRTSWTAERSRNTLSVRYACWGRDLDPPAAPAVVMMEPQPAIKFADAEKVPRVALPAIRWQGRFIYLKQLQKMPGVISHLEKER